MARFENHEEITLTEMFLASPSDLTFLFSLTCDLGSIIKSFSSEISYFPNYTDSKQTIEF